MSSLAKYMNGFHGYIRGRDEVHFEAIASKFELDIADVRKIAYEAEDSIKKPKPIKVQKRQPKSNLNDDGTKQERKKSGYWYFCKESRGDVVDMLKNNPKSRKFTTKAGKHIDVKPSDFDAKSGNPSFTHVNQKCSQLWWALSDEERAEWESKVAEYCENERKKKSGGCDDEEEGEEKNSDEEAEENDEEEEENEEEEEETPKKPVKKAVPKATATKGEGRTQKTTAKAPVKKALPPPKGKANTKTKK